MKTQYKYKNIYNFYKHSEFEESDPILVFGISISIGISHNNTILHKNMNTKSFCLFFFIPMAYVENQLGCFKNKCWNDHSLSATDTLYLELLPEDSGSEVVPETPPHSRPQEDEGSDLTEPSTDSTGNQHLRHTDKQKVTMWYWFWSWNGCQPVRSQD